MIRRVLTIIHYQLFYSIIFKNKKYIYLYAGMQFFDIGSSSYTLFFVLFYGDFRQVCPVKSLNDGTSEGSFWKWGTCI